MPASGHFYPRLEYGTGPTVIDIDRLAGVVIRIVPDHIRGQNVSLAGQLETLSIRLEMRLFLGLTNLSATTQNALDAWFQTWASVGRQTTITLDRFGTCAGQWEFDGYNLHFTRAELVTNPPDIARLTLARPFYQQAFLFRQGR